MKLHQFTDKDIDDYSSYVLHHADATPYHHAAWGDAVSSSYGFNKQYFGLVSNDNILAILPIVKMKNLGASTILCSLPYCDLGGVLADSIEAKRELLRLVTKYANSHKIGFEYRDTENYKLDDNEGDRASTTQIVDGSKVRMLYDLQHNVDDQLAFFKPKLRSQIKKASKNGIEARIVALPSQLDIQTFYEVFSTNMRDLGSPVHSIEWFKAIFEQYKNNAFLVLVYLKDKCVGGGVVIHTHKKAVIPWASTLREYNKLAPNMLLYWAVLSEVIRRNIFEFDFGRSSFNEGTYRFKKQWGAQAVPLMWKHLENGELVDEQSTKSSKIRNFVESSWQKLPLGLTIFIGPKIRKFISL